MPGMSDASLPYPGGDCTIAGMTAREYRIAPIRDQAKMHQTESRQSISRKAD